ncbi:MAG: hypothetical protein ACP5SH_25470 [Syntrophobacteraceae bacterium]
MEPLIDAVRIPCKYGETVRIKTLWDLHVGNAACDLPALKKFLDDKESWFIGGGDWADSIITSDLKRYQKSMDATEGDDIIDATTQQLYDLLSPIRDRILAAGEGNHEQTIEQRCGTHPVKRLCKMLGVPFRGYSYFLPIVFKVGAGEVHRTFEVTIKAHHGFGGGRTLGADLTRYYQDLAPYEADIYCFGHTHQKHWTPIDRLGLSRLHNGKRALVSREQHIVVCGTFLKTLSDSTVSTYSERKGYRPTSVGNVTICIKLTEKPPRIWIER